MPPLSELFDLSGRVAIVTGGSRGLGQEIAEGLAEAGASLMLCARRDEWLAPAIAAMRGRGFAVEGLRCDVARPDDVQALVDAAIARFGKIDILVNNAGVTWGAEPETMPLDKWQKVLDINLTGAFLFAQAAGRDMLTRQWGRIINIASLPDCALGLVRLFAYAATNRSHGLTRELAHVGRQGIRRQRHRAWVLSVADGDGALVTATDHQGPQPHSARWQPGERRALRLPAADASNYITGQTIVVDGAKHRETHHRSVRP